MIDLCARLDVEGTSAKFLTLTFSGYPTPRQAKVIFTKFLKRIARKAPQASSVWRAEMQKRGSPHFHLIIFNIGYIKQREYQRMWEACTGETKPAQSYRRVTIVRFSSLLMRSSWRRYVKRSRVDIRKLKNHKMVMYYVSKYCAKKPLLDNGSYLTDFEKEWTGRHWGIHNRKCLPIAKREIAIIRDPELFNYFRSMVKLVTRGASGYSPLGAKLYTDEAQQWYEQALRLSEHALMRNDYKQDNGYRYSRATLKRVQLWFGITP